MPLYKFDFSSAEYKRFLEVCPFTDDELKIIDMRRHGKSVLQISFELNIAERTVSKYIKSITKKISKEL
nr:MAG TPA: ECF sigma factor [Caudoviricetes sp.]